MDSSSACPVATSGLRGDVVYRRRGEIGAVGGCVRVGEREGEERLEVGSMASSAILEGGGGILAVGTG